LKSLHFVRSSRKKKMAPTPHRTAKTPAGLETNILFKIAIRVHHRCPRVYTQLYYRTEVTDRISGLHAKNKPFQEYPAVHVKETSRYPLPESSSPDFIWTWDFLCHNLNNQKLLIFICSDKNSDFYLGILAMTYKR